MGKALLKAGIYGGCYGLLVQVFYTIYSLIWPTTNYLGALALGTGGLVVAILYVFGIIQKVEPEAGFGGILPLIGVPSMISSRLNAARKQDKKIVIDAFWDAGKPSMLMLMSSMVVTLVIARIATNVVGPLGAFPIAPPQHANVPLEFVFSFLIMFVLSVFGQVLLMKLKPTFDGVMGILFGLYVAGGVLACLGLSQLLLAVGPGGWLASIMGAGEFVFTSVWIGDGTVTFTRLVIFSGLIGSMYMWGALAAVLRGRMHPDEIN